MITARQLASLGDLLTDDAAQIITAPKGMLSRRLI